MTTSSLRRHDDSDLQYKCMIHIFQSSAGVNPFVPAQPACHRRRISRSPRDLPDSAPSSESDLVKGWPTTLSNSRAAAD